MNFISRYLFEFQFNLRQGFSEHGSEVVAGPSHGPFEHVLDPNFVPSPQVALHSPYVHSDHVGFGAK